MDKLRSMEVFVAVVEAGSFAGAARHCAMSAVMVGKHIHALEQMLGAVLLTRTTRRQALTEIGLRYAGQCRAILAQIGEAESVAEAMRAALPGRDGGPEPERMARRARRKTCSATNAWNSPAGCRRRGGS